MARKTRNTEYFQVKVAQRKNEGDLVGLKLLCPKKPAYENVDSWEYKILRFAANFGLKFDWQASKKTMMFPVYHRKESSQPVKGEKAINSFLGGYFSFLLHGFVDSCVNEFHLPNGSWGRPYRD